MLTNNASWFLFVGVLLLCVGMATPVIKRLPVTSAIIYLTVGMIVGPMGFAFFHINPLKSSALLEILTEIAVLISLFAAGVKMPVPVSFKRWHHPLRLAFLSMVVSVALVAAFAHLILGLALGAAILLGAIIAPTDPVLATEVQIRHPGDRDRLRFPLTCEAGINDGSAFPFVMLGLGLLNLHDLGSFGLRWLVVDLLWATLSGIAIGVIAGYGVAHLVACFRRKNQIEELLEDFLGLGLIAAVYGLSQILHAWGFLAVFAAAVSLRQTELQLASRKYSSLPNASVDNSQTNPAPRHLSETSLVFKEHLERLSEIVLILLIGGTLFIDSWSWRAVSLALFLFMVVRPLSVFAGLLFTKTPWRIRALIGWFGVRGIGSLYYLMFAIQHGLPKELGLELIHLTLVVVTLSIFIHGISVKPLINRFWTNK